MRTDIMSGIWFSGTAKTLALTIRYNNNRMMSSESPRGEQSEPRLDLSPKEITSGIVCFCAPASVCQVCDLADPIQFENGKASIVFIGSVQLVPVKNCDNIDTNSAPVFIPFPQLSPNKDEDGAKEVLSRAGSDDAANDDAQLFGKMMYVICSGLLTSVFVCCVKVVSINLRY
jgi:hypothetical protein